MIKSLSTTLSTVDTVHGPGLLHPFPNQDDLWSRGALPIDRSPLSTDQGSMTGCFCYKSLNLDNHKLILEGLCKQSVQYLQLILIDFAIH